MAIEQSAQAAKYVDFAVRKIVTQAQVADLEFGPTNLSVETRFEHVARHLVFQLNAYFAAKEHVEPDEVINHVTIKNPATPWQFFKECYFPNAILRYFPVTYVINIRPVKLRRVTVKMCPHLQIPERRSHIEFMLQP